MPTESSPQGFDAFDIVLMRTAIVTTILSIRTGKLAESLPKELAEDFRKLSAKDIARLLQDLNSLESRLSQVLLHHEAALFAELLDSLTPNSPVH